MYLSNTHIHTWTVIDNEYTTYDVYAPCRSATMKADRGRLPRPVRRVKIDSRTDPRAGGLVHTSRLKYLTHVGTAQIVIKM